MTIRSDLPVYQTSLQTRHDDEAPQCMICEGGTEKIYEPLSYEGEHAVYRVKELASFLCTICDVVTLKNDAVIEFLSFVVTSATTHGDVALASKVQQTLEIARRIQTEFYRGNKIR